MEHAIESKQNKIPGNAIYGMQSTIVKLIISNLNANFFQ